MPERALVPEAPGLFVVRRSVSTALWVAAMRCSDSIEGEPTKRCRYTIHLSSDCTTTPGVFYEYKNVGC